MWLLPPCLLCAWGPGIGLVGLLRAQSTPGRWVLVPSVNDSAFAAATPRRGTPATNLSCSSTCSADDGPEQRRHCHGHDRHPLDQVRYVAFQALLETRVTARPHQALHQG